MRTVISTLFVAALCLADKPALAPAYEGSGAEAYAAPAAPAVVKEAVPETYGAPVAAPAPDSYGSPSTPVVAQESYGSPAAAPVGGDPYGALAAPVQTSAPVGNQGYYYYYYPVRQNEPAPVETEDDDSIIGLITALLTKKIVVIALGLGAFLLLTALGINLTIGGRSLQRSMESSWEFAAPYATEGNLIALADFVNRSIRKFQ